MKKSLGQKLFYQVWLSLCVVPFLGYGQLSSGFLLEAKAVVGTHATKDKAGMLPNSLYGIDLSWQKDLSQKNVSWMRISKAQSAGISFVFRNLDRGYRDTSASLLGQTYGLSAQTEFRLLKLNKASVSFTPGMGLAYFTKTYFTHQQNRFIGSRVNHLIKADLSAVIALSDQINLVGGVGFLHYSNGGFQIPNGGLNTLNLFTGLRFVKPGARLDKETEKYRVLQRSSVEIAAGIGRRGVFQQRDGLYKSGFYAGYNYFVNDFLTIKAGLDAVYYYTPYNPDPQKALQTFQYFGTSYARWRGGLSLGPEINMNRISVNAQWGKYLYYNRYYKNITWYWTTNLAYAITPQIGVHGRTYFHKLQADFTSYGLFFKI